MRGRLGFGVGTVAVVLALGSCKDDVGVTVSERFVATLSGASSRPTPITTTATGTAEFTYVADLATLFYRIDVASIDSVFLAHIHAPADTGQTNGVVLNLWLGSNPAKGLAFTRTLPASCPFTMPGGESHGSSSFNAIGRPRRGAARGRLWWGRWWRHGALHAGCGDSAREERRGRAGLVLQQPTSRCVERQGAGREQLRGARRRGQLGGGVGRRRRELRTEHHECVGCGERERQRRRVDAAIGDGDARHHDSADAHFFCHCGYAADVGRGEPEEHGLQPRERGRTKRGDRYLDLERRDSAQRHVHERPDAQTGGFTDTDHRYLSGHVHDSRDLRLSLHDPWRRSG